MESMMVQSLTDAKVTNNYMQWRNLAPTLIRQRIMIEGISDHVITEEEIKAYLLELSVVLKMRPLRNPYSYVADDKGYGGWIHWVTSGAHFYSYTTTPPFFSVDAYTCKPFDPAVAAEFTRQYFNAKELVWKEVEV